MHKSYNTVEPPNKGHFGTSHFVLCWEVVLFLEVKNEWERCPELRPLLGGCPYLGGSFIRGSTVCTEQAKMLSMHSYLWQWWTSWSCSLPCDGLVSSPLCHAPLPCHAPWAPPLPAGGGWRHEQQHCCSNSPNTWSQETPYDLKINVHMYSVTSDKGPSIKGITSL